MQHAIAVGKGVVAAHTDDDLDYEWGRACSQFEHEYEIFRTLAETNADRQTARAMKETGRMTR